MKTARIIIECLALATLLAVPASAQWVQVAGVPPGNVNFLTTDGSNIYAQTSSGFLYSTDYGTTWMNAKKTIMDSATTRFPLDSTNFLLQDLYDRMLPLVPFTPSQADSVLKGLDVSMLISMLESAEILAPGTNLDSILISIDTASAGKTIPQLLSELSLYAGGFIDTSYFSGISLDSLFISFDLGSKWMPVYELLSTVTIREVEKTDTYFFAATNKGVYRVTSDGDVWSPSNSGLTNTNVHALLYLSPRLFAGTDAGVFVSTNNAVTWAPANVGYTHTPVYDLVASGTYLFAATHGAGVLLSKSNGTSWVPFNTGLTNVNVNALAISGTKVFAGTNGSGMWKRKVSDALVGVASAVEHTPASFELMQNYPNPFNPSTTIRFGIPTRSYVRLHIYNQLGQELGQLADGVFDAGFYASEWSPNAASGLYFCRIEAVSITDPGKRFVDVKKMLLMK